MANDYITQVKTNNNTNLVKKWAENMLSDCNSAISALSGPNRDYTKAIQFMGEIKGTCETIIACMSTIN